MSDSVYSFRAGPTYRAASRQELFDSAMEQPLSLTSTFFDQAKGGMLESYGLGTAVRDFAIPDGAVTPEATARSALRLTNPLTTAYESTRLAVQAFREDSPVLDEAKYKSSPWYRENIPWDAGMTEARARALAEWNDAKQVRQYYAQKRPISAFLGNLTGQAFDPINYVPVGGPLVKAAAVARSGRIGGTVVTGAVDAATNTALAGLATRETRERFGDDVSFQAMVSEIATAALIGAAFGGVSGAMEARTAARALADAQRSLSTLKATQEARIALNEAIDGVVRGEDVTLSPNATDTVVKATNAAVNMQIDPPMLRSAAYSHAGDAIAFDDAVQKRLYELGARLNAGETGASIDAETDVLFAAYGRFIAGDQINDVGEFKTALQDVADYIDDLVVSGDDHAGSLIDPEMQLEWSRLMASPDFARAATPDANIVAAETSITGAFMRGEIVSYRSTTGEPLTAKRVFPSMDHPIGGVEIRRGSDGKGRLVASPVMNEAELRNFVGALGLIGRRPSIIDASSARIEGPPEGHALAETRIAKPDNYKALADQYRVDPETGDFPELADIDNLRAEGRLTADDIAELDAASATVDDAKAYGEALKTVIGCLV